MNHQQRNRRWGYARNTRRLAQSLWTGRTELALDLLGETGDVRVIDIHRQFGVFAGPQACDFILLTVDVTGVFGLDFDLFGDLWIFCAPASHGDQTSVVDFRTDRKSTR